MGHPRILRRLSYLIIPLILLPNRLMASDDPCIGLAMMVAPAVAAGLAAKRDGMFKPRSLRKLEEARKGREKPDNDGQKKEEWAADGFALAAKWNALSAPIFGALAARAFAEMKIPVGTKLLECAARRGGQAGAHSSAEKEARAAAAKIREHDPDGAYALAYVPKVISVRGLPGSDAGGTLIFTDNFSLETMDFTPQQSAEKVSESRADVLSGDKFDEFKKELEKLP